MCHARWKEMDYERLEEGLCALPLFPYGFIDTSRVVITVKCTCNVETLKTLITWKS